MGDWLNTNVHCWLVTNTIPPFPCLADRSPAQVFLPSFIQFLKQPGVLLPRAHGTFLVVGGNGDLKTEMTNGRRSKYGVC